MEANPFESMIILIVALGPLFDHLNNEMKENTENIQTKSKWDEDVLPMTDMSVENRNKSVKNIKFRVNHFVPSLWTSLTSVIFITYLLVRRHEITPDLFHFVTCL